MSSKLCQANIVFSNELARRYGDHGIVSTSLNPGLHLSNPLDYPLSRLDD